MEVLMDKSNYDVLKIENKKSMNVKELGKVAGCTNLEPEEAAVLYKILYKILTK